MMNNAYSAYFKSQQYLQKATQYLEYKKYEDAALALEQAIQSSLTAAKQPVFTDNAIQAYTTGSILLIAIYIRLSNQELAQKKQQETSQQLRKWSHQASSQQTKSLCRYCSQLLITGCLHSRCVGHYVQQLEELNHAQEQT